MTGGEAPARAPPILFRDQRFVVLNKPAGMPVHPSRHDPAPSVESVFGLLGPAKHGPFLAHRLDRDTSGCLVVALRRSALRAAQACFASGMAAQGGAAQGGAEKTYWALVEDPGTRAGGPGAGGPGASEPGAGLVEVPIRRVERGGRWRMEPHADAPPAATAWRRLGRDAARGIAWLELTPRTGRTHQIRVHCALLGWPVLGDAIYGRGGVPLALHARAIRLPLDPPVAAVAPPPAHMLADLRSCGWSAPDGGLRAP